MKTTVEISDTLLAQAKALAAKEGTTLRALIERGLRDAVQRKGPVRPFRLRRVVVDGAGLQSDVAGSRWEQLRDLAYTGRGA
jgi:hypothetical protein